MYINFEQLAKSLKKLDSAHPFFGTSFLAFKELGLSVNDPRRVNIANQETFLLENYYNPVPSSGYYYMPLRSGSGRKNRWVLKSKYPTSGLQKTRTTTFSRVFLHPTPNEWAWSPDYLSRLSSLQGEEKVPAFHLAVWMFRNKIWNENTKPEGIIDDFFTQFNISEEEREKLFNTKNEVYLISTPLLQEEPITSKKLRELIGSPPDFSPDEGGGLESLTLIGVGPAKYISIDLAPRLNIITGDNGLGKTFLLDCAWWALSGRWADPEIHAYPRLDSVRPSIGFHISGSSGEPKQIFFNKATQSWPAPDEKRPVLPGVVLYARVDGSCMIWDPVKHYWLVQAEYIKDLNTYDVIRLSQNQIWHGLEITKNGAPQVICNGLIRDWVTWQYRPAIGAFGAFKQVLEKLSPHRQEFVLKPGNPATLPNDAREFPTLIMPYGEVPVPLLSAGIKRILSLAYLLVWTWEQHKVASRKLGKEPQSKLVFLIDEMEAHLHPQWQRIIVPALIDVIRILEEDLEVQLIIATHSPLVMASVEPIFQDKLDSLFTLDLTNQELEARELQYIKYGSINSWLTSEVFDLARPYSIDAENALVDAKKIQMMDNPDPDEIRDVSSRLAQYLPDIDPIWPRWKFFAERNGVNL